MVIFPPNSLKQWFTSHCENRGWSFLSTQIIKICGLIQPLLNHTNCEQTSLESLFKRRRYFNSDSLESWVGFTSSSTVVITTQQFIYDCRMASPKRAAWRLGLCAGSPSPPICCPWGALTWCCFFCYCGNCSSKPWGRKVFALIFQIHHMI